MCNPQTNAAARHSVHSKRRTGRVATPSDHHRTQQAAVASSSAGSDVSHKTPGPRIANASNLGPTGMRCNQHGISL